MTKIIFILAILLANNRVILAQFDFDDEDSVRSVRVMKHLRSGVQSLRAFTYDLYDETEQLEDSYDSTVYSRTGDSIIEKRYNLYKGKYPKLSEIGIYSSDGKPLYYRTYSRSYFSSEILYDRNGKRLRVFAKNLQDCDENTKDSLYLKELFEYDEDGQRTKQVYFDASGRIVSKTESHYDDNLSENLYYSRGDFSNIPDSVEWDEAMKLVEAQELKLTGRWVYAIDSSVRTKFTYQDKGSDSTLYCKLVDTFDINWNLLKHEVYHNEGRPDYFYTVAYDNFGHIIQEKHFFKDTVTHITTYKYDPNGRLIVKSRKENHYETDRTEWKYDKQGNLIDEKSISRWTRSNKKERQHEDRKTWIYDSKNNLTAETKYLLGDPFRTTRYQYVYK
jgi:YD repeat-containing protein